MSVRHDWELRLTHEWARERPRFHASVGRGDARSSVRVLTQLETSLRPPNPMTVPFDSLAIFAEMPAPSREVLGRVMRLRELADGEVLLEEGTPTELLYVLARGTVAVTSHDHEHDETHAVAEMTEGAVLGEMSIFDGLPTTATVTAKGPCKVWEIPFVAIRPGGALVSTRTPEALALGEAYEDLVAQVAKTMASRLREMSKSELLRARERAAMGLFVVDALVLLAGYAVLLSVLPNVRSSIPSSSSFLSLPLIGLFAYGGIKFIRRTGLPLERFGLGFRYSLGSLALSLVVTPLLLLATWGAKTIAVAVNPAWHGIVVIERPDLVARFSEPHVQKLMLVYSVSCVVQELIVRSALQSGLSLFLRGKGANVRAILVAALLFAVNHLHMSSFLAAAAFFPGVVWGVMYARRPHILGVTLSHVAMGAFVFFVLGTNLP